MTPKFYVIIGITLAVLIIVSAAGWRAFGVISHEKLGYAPPRWLKPTRAEREMLIYLFDVLECSTIVLTIFLIIREHQQRDDDDIIFTATIGCIVWVVACLAHIEYWRKNIRIPESRSEAALWVLGEAIHPYRQRSQTSGKVISAIGALSDNPYLYSAGLNEQTNARVITLESRQRVPGPQSLAILRTSIRQGETNFSFQPLEFQDVLFPAHLIDAKIDNESCSAKVTLDGERVGPFQFRVKFDESKGHWTLNTLTPVDDEPLPTRGLRVFLAQ